MLADHERERAEELLRSKPHVEAVLRDITAQLADVERRAAAAAAEHARDITALSARRAELVGELRRIEAAKEALSK